MRFLQGWEPRTEARGRPLSQQPVRGQPGAHLEECAARLHDRPRGVYLGRCHGQGCLRRGVVGQVRCRGADAPRRCGRPRLPGSHLERELAEALGRQQAGAARRDTGRHGEG